MSKRPTQFGGPDTGDEPLLNYWMSLGEKIEIWLSFREAAKELGLDPMVEQRKSIENQKK